MPQTKSYIVSNSSMPVSVIIIGVGENSFELMSELDADRGPLKDISGAQAVRDIVQFVKFSDYSTKGYHALSEEVLKEIPDQVVNYLVKNSIQV